METLKLDISNIRNRAIISYDPGRESLVVELQRFIDGEWVTMIDVLSNHHDIDVTCSKTVEA